MFGMLDYRAHKLYRLLTFPFHIISLIIFISIIVIGIRVARSTDFAWWAKIVIAFLVTELVLMIWSFLLNVVLRLFTREPRQISKQTSQR